MHFLIFFDLMKISRLRSHEERLQNFDDILKIVFSFGTSSSIRYFGFLRTRFLREFWNNINIGFFDFVLHIFHRFKEEILCPDYIELFRSISFSLNQNSVLVRNIFEILINRSLKKIRSHLRYLRNLSFYFLSISHFRAENLVIFGFIDF